LQETNQGTVAVSTFVTRRLVTAHGLIETGMW